MNCRMQKESLLDLVENNLSDTEEIELKKHIEQCEECAAIVLELEESIHKLIDVREYITVPDEIVDEIRNKKYQFTVRNTKQIRIGIVAAVLSIFMVTTTLASGGLEELVVWWQKLLYKDQTVLQKTVDMGFSEALNVIAEDNNIRMKITHIVSDDIQTMVYYEIEDMQQKGKYDLASTQSYFRTTETWNPLDKRYIEPTSNNEQPFVQWGILYLEPITSTEKQLSLKFDKMERIVDQRGISPQLSNEVEVVTGEWNFEIHVKKSPTFTYEINKTVHIEEITIQLDQLISGPTATFLKYRSFSSNPDLIVGGITISHINSNDKKYEAWKGSTSSWQRGMEATRHEALFEPIYFDNPEKLSLHISGIETSYNHPETFLIDPAQPFPQTFEYHEGKFSIEGVVMEDEYATIQLVEEYPESTFARSHMFIKINDDNDSIRNQKVTLQQYVDQEGKVHFFDSQIGIKVEDNWRLVKAGSEISFKIGENPIPAIELMIMGARYKYNINQQLKIDLQ